MIALAGGAFALFLVVATILGALGVSPNPDHPAAASTARPAVATSPAVIDTAPATPVTATSPATPPPAVPPPSAAPLVFGFGATVADWNSHHAPDTRFPPGAAYDHDPSIVPSDPNRSARYVGVSPTYGRVFTYTEQFEPGTGLDAAETRVLAEFPSDRTLLAAVRKDTCVQVIVGSAILRQALASLGYGSSDFAVELNSDDVTPGTYDPQHVTDALFTGFGASVTNVPDC